MKTSNLEGVKGGKLFSERGQHSFTDTNTLWLPMFLPQSCQYKFVKNFLSFTLLYSSGGTSGGIQQCVLPQVGAQYWTEEKVKKNRKEELQKKGRNCFVGISYMFLLSPGIGLTHRWKRTEGRNCAMGTPPFEMNCSWNAMTAKSSKDLLVFKPSCKQCLA